MHASKACLLPGCRKWPTAHSFQPKQLDCVTSATVEQLVTNDCKVLWSPAPPVSSILSYLTGGSKWVPASEACLVQPSDYRASAVIINVGRRCGLQIPENVPLHVFKASKQAHVPCACRLSCATQPVLHSFCCSKWLCSTCNDCNPQVIAVC